MNISRKKRLLLAVPVILAALALLLWLPGSRKTGWTVMVYMVGSDLESGHGLATRDLEEMAASVRPDTRLLVMKGGASSWAGEAPPDGCGIYRVSRNEITLLESGAESMGSPAALSRLLRAGLQNASGPTALILWDHGYGALEGFGSDERAEDPEEKRLTMEELCQAFQAELGSGKLSLLGFDACLMASVETALAVFPYAEYLTTSQETEPPDGWDYGFLQDLAPHVQAAEAGNLIISRFHETCQRWYETYPQLEQPYTLSLIRLSGMESLRSATDSFLSDLSGKMAQGGFSPISRLRARSYALGRGTTATDYDLIDLAQFTGLFLDLSPFAQPVLDALDDCVERQETSIPGLRGLSFYFPYRAREENRARWHGRLKALPLGAGWQSFLEDYEKQLDTRRELSSPAERDSAFAVVLDDDLLADFERAKYYVLEETDEGEMRLLYAGNDYLLQDHTVTVPYHGQILKLRAGDGECLLPAFYIQEDGQAAYYHSYVVTLKDHNATPKPVRLRTRYEKSSASWRVLSAFDISGTMTTGRQEIRLEDQIEVWIPTYSYRPARTQTDSLLSFTQWEALPYPEIVFLHSGGEYSLREDCLEKQEGSRYWLQIVVVDTYQTEYASSLFPV